MIYVRKNHSLVLSGCNNMLILDKIKNALMFKNPKYVQLKNMGFSLKGISEYLFYYKIIDSENTIEIPREFPIEGYIDEFVTIDERAKGEKVSFPAKLLKPLYKDQNDAVEQLEKNQGGIIVMPAGSGKTVVGIEMIRRCGVKALILVHKNFLMDQWANRIENFLGVEVGKIGNGYFDLDKPIVIGMIQSLLRQERIFREFGLVISDEVHRLGSEQWSKVIRKFPGKLRVGLTATDKRTDGLEKIFIYGIGSIVYRKEEKFKNTKVFQIKINTKVPYYKAFSSWRNKLDLGMLITTLSKDRKRNELIIDKIIEINRVGRTVLVLSHRVKHLKYLKEKLEGTIRGKIGLYIGETSREDRQKLEEKGSIILATVQMVKEALDIPRLDTLVLTTPIGNKLGLIQATGRIQRKFKGKKFPVIIDIVDSNMLITLGMARKRKFLYEKLGYSVKDFKI